MAMLPPAPPRFSTITLWPSSLASASTMIRARMSTGPAAANGTMTRTGPAAAQAGMACPSTAAQTAAVRMPRRVKGTSAAIRPARRLPPGLVGLAPIGLPAVARTDPINGGRPGHVGSGGGIEHHRRPTATAGRIDGGAQNPPIGADRLVRLPEMLLCAILDRPHGLAGPLVVDVYVHSHARGGRVLLLGRVEAVNVALCLSRGRG